MLTNPKSTIDQLLQHMKERKLDFRIYVHANSDINFLSQYDCHQDNIGIAVESAEPLGELAFYSKFPEVQMMSVTPGKQGQQFMVQSLDKVTQLEQMGYTGRVSLDGGINLDSARVISLSSVDRVSVGSYFQKSENLLSDYQKLHQALNHAQSSNQAA